MRPYASRAAAVILLWTELLDDMPLAEACASPEAFRARRDVFRRELRRSLEARGVMEAPEKWVQRMFLAKPPRRGTLEPAWREPLLEWIHEGEIGSEALFDLDLAVRALFAEGDEADLDLHRRRPALAACIARVLADPIELGPSPHLAASSVVLDDCWCPMYMTDADFTHTSWANRSFQALIGLAADRLRGMPLAELRRLVESMIPPEELANFTERQDQVLEAGRMVGRGYIATVIDLARRGWTMGMPTPPWQGRYRVELHAHFVLDAKGQRLGSLVVWLPVALSTEAR